MSWLLVVCVCILIDGDALHLATPPLSQQMLSTGIPELQKKEDIMYLQKALNLGKSNEDANGIFLKLINESLDSLATKLNNMFHLMAH